MLLAVVGIFAGIGCPLTDAVNLSLVKNHCASQVNLIYVEIVKRFLQDEEYLTGIETDDIQDGIGFTLHCFLNGIEKPLVLYTYEEFRQIRRSSINTQDDTNGYSPLEGFLSRGKYETFIQSLIPSVAQWNPLGKLILSGRYITRQQILYMFRLAWVQYRMPNVLFVNRIDNASIESCLFNPFLTNPGVIDTRNVDCHTVRSLEEVVPYVQYAKIYLFERFRNLQLYPLRIAIADVELMSQAVYSKDKKLLRFEYLDGEIVDIMKRMMNFTTNFVILPSQLSTGFVFPNGSLGGSLDLIERHRIDLAANTRIIHSYQTTNLQYLRHLMTTKLVFIVPKNYYESRSRDRVFFNTFTWWFYAINISMAVALPLILKMVDLNSTGAGKDSYMEAMMNTLAITLAVSAKLPKRFHARAVLCGVMLYSMVSYSIWQAIIIKRLNSNSDFLDDIQGLTELLDSNLQPIIPVAYGEFIRPSEKDYFAMDGLHQKLYQKATVANNNVTGAMLIVDMLKQRSSAVLIHDIRSDAVKARFYDEQHQQSSVHVINEYVFEFYTAMALPKDSPFLEQLNGITTRCVETGIVANQLSKILFKGKLYQIAKNRNSSLAGIDGSGATRFELRVWRYVFYCYFGLNALALVVFLGELIVHGVSLRRKVYLRRRKVENVRRTEPFARVQRVKGVKWAPHVYWDK
ncbi:uncharacterized protein LOC131676176 [Topomyia yanbarensis]|uniref:uncharacterized protein LOC131676176 n=1 Tax=Topomyia yanbarensis TaxID=2498891 RepID=UPI00273B05E2|nr:uncharacterized protein LOC131676176 [Topomyia yanbarensis]